mgnify:CR=1 FL=1
MRPQDIVVLLKKCTDYGRDMNNKQLAESLHISASEISESLERSRYAGLIDHKKKKVNIAALVEFLVYGLKYVYPAIPKGIVRGMATGASAYPLNNILNKSEEKFVWKYKDGKDRGQEITPLYTTVPLAAEEDKQLYELLSLTDALRTGSIRELGLAKKEIIKLLIGNEE